MGRKKGSKNKIPKILGENLFLHHCIKGSCGKEYKDAEPDDFYCPDCTIEKKAIADRIDRKFGTTAGQKPQGLNVIEERARANGGIVNANTMFIKARDLGL